MAVDKFINGGINVIVDNSKDIDPESNRHNSRNDLGIVLEYLFKRARYKYSSKIITVLSYLDSDSLDKVCDSCRISESDKKKAQDINNKLRFDTIEFDDDNLIPSIKIDGNYLNETKLTHWSKEFKTINKKKNHDYKKIDTSHLKPKEIFQRSMEFIKIFEEYVDLARKKYNFELKIVNNYIDEKKGFVWPKGKYQVFIETDESMKYADLWYASAWFLPVFQINWWRNNIESKAWYSHLAHLNLWNYEINDAVKEDIRMSLHTAIHRFTENKVESV